MEYLEVSVKDGVILLHINNTQEFIEYIDDILSKSVNKEIVSQFFYREYFDIALRNEILKRIKTIDTVLEVNKPYLIKINIYETVQHYNLVKLESEELGSGLNISKTLLV